MTRISNELFISLPRKHSPRFKVEIIKGGNTDTYGPSDTNNLISAKWSKPITESTGICTISLSNIERNISNKYTGDEIIRIYADSDGNPATTKRFEGFLDFAKDQYDNIRTIEIEGRHISGELLEINVTKSYIQQEPSVVLKDLFTNFAPSLTGYTTNNVSATSLIKNFNFQDKSFWECVIDICRVSGFDCFVDDDKDVHFFKRNSRHITNDSIIWGDNLRWLKNFGIDNYNIKNKVRVYGEDDAGEIIIYTTPETVTGRPRETKFKDSNLKTYQQCKDFGDAKLAEIQRKNDEGIVMSLGLPNARPGDSIFISNPEANIHGRFRILEMKHSIGNVGWTTETTVEKETGTIPIIFRERVRNEQFLQSLDNINNLNHTYNFTFNDDNGLHHSNTKTLNGKLVLQTGKSSGIMVTDSRNANVDITKVELKILGKDLGATTFKFSTIDGVDFEDITIDELVIPVNVGRQLQLRISLNSNTENPAPEIESASLLYS